MNEQMYDDIQLEEKIRTLFGLQLDVDSVVARRIPVSRADVATVFLSKKKQLYVYIEGQTRTVRDDVRKISQKMGLVVESYVPPKGRPHYFEEVAMAKFQSVYPGRRNVTREDLAFYMTLVPYSPALLVIKEIKDGEVLQFDPDAHTKWRRAAKFSYRRIATS